VADGWDGDGEGGVMGLLDLLHRCATKHIVISLNVVKIEMFFYIYPNCANERRNKNDFYYHCFLKDYINYDYGLKSYSRHQTY
jgi:hypothetical protein